MTTIVHVNQAILKKNRITGERQPALTLKRKSGGKVTRAHEAVAHDEHGREMFRVVYRPDHPLPCGAVCWVETKLEVTPQETEMAATATKSKPVTHSFTVSVKAPGDLSPAKVQKALQAALDHGCSSCTDAKAKEDLAKCNIAKAKLVKPTPTPTPDPANSGNEPRPGSPS